MQISKDTQNVIDFLDKYSDNTLKAKDDLTLIIEITATSNKPELLSDLIFTGSSINNSILSLTKESETDKDPIKQELVKLQNVLANHLNEVIELVDESDKASLMKYIVINPDNFQHQLHLAYDFSVMKKMQNDIKFRNEKESNT